MRKRTHPSPYLNLRMPYAFQGKESSNCGPCSIKMIADYYGVRRKSGESYSVHSLNRLCRVSRMMGCEKSDMARVLKLMGLQRTRVQFIEIPYALASKSPVLALIEEESGQGHYVVIKGIDFVQDELIFHDPFWGRNFRRKRSVVKNQLKSFGNWIWSIQSIKSIKTTY